MPPPFSLRTMPPERRQRIFRILRIFVVILVFLLVFLPTVLGFFSIWTLTHLPCGASTPPDAAGMPDYEAVEFESKSLNRQLRGYFVKGTNGITIIIPPALSSGAGNWMTEFVLLHRSGYNLFNYESRNCAGYTNSLGYLEVDQVGDALDYLETRADVDMDRIGAYGFSAGGATSIMAAARYPRIKAVIAMGGYHDFSAMVADAENTWYGILYGAGARLGYRLSTGLDMTVLSPVSVIHHIAPRPIQLIYGSREPSLPGAYLQQQAAGSNADLWVIENATHGAYWQNAPDTFEARISAFMDAAFAVQAS